MTEWPLFSWEPESMRRWFELLVAKGLLDVSRVLTVVATGILNHVEPQTYQVPDTYESA